MKHLTLRRLAGAASAAALVSASAFFGSTAAFSQPEPDPSDEQTSSVEPSSEPTTSTPSSDPTDTPTPTPTSTPTEDPTEVPTATPTQDPATFSIGASSISAEELTTTGVDVTVTGAQEGDRLEVTGNLLLKTEGTVTAEGTATVQVMSENTVEQLEAAGTLDGGATIYRDGTAVDSENFDLTITSADDGSDEAAFDPQVSAAPKEITASALADENQGITVTVTNIKAGDVVSDSLTDESETADGESVQIRLFYEGDPSDFEVGDTVDFTVTVSREGEESKTFDFTVTIVGEDDGDDETWEPELTIAPEKISVTEFRNENKGVKLTLTGCYPGEIATFVIEKSDGSLSYETEAETDEHGTAVIEHIYGTGNAADSAYIGTYHVTATCIEGEEEAHGEFTVHSGDDSKGGGDSDKGQDRDGGRDRDRNELPRTGSDLTALCGAAGLLAVGAAAMVVGRRKSTKE